MRASGARKRRGAAVTRRELEASGPEVDRRNCGRSIPTVDTTPSDLRGRKICVDTPLDGSILRAGPNRPPRGGLTTLGRRLAMTNSNYMGARILILESDDNARSALRELLTDEGYEVFAAADGTDRLEELLIQFEPDLVLVDADPPWSNGPALVAAADPNRPRAATVLLMSIRAESKRADAHVLAKPLDVDELLKTIAGLLRARRRSFLGSDD